MSLRTLRLSPSATYTTPSASTAIPIGPLNVAFAHSPSRKPCSPVPATIAIGSSSVLSTSSFERSAGGAASFSRWTTAARAAAAVGLVSATAACDDSR